MNRLSIGLLGFLYVGYLLILTLTPFEFSANVSSVTHGMAGLFSWSSAGDFVNNVVFLIPFGYLLYCWRQGERQGLSAFLSVILIGAITSVLVEVLQLFFSRHSSVFDVLANSMGTGIGALVCAAAPIRIADLPFRLCMRAMKWPGMVCIAVAYGSIPFILAVTQFLAPFSLWNSGFTFQMGNEATLDRPWLGTIHLVALYNRALSDKEVNRKFKEGVMPESSSRLVDEGVIALYTFSERQDRIIHDRSHFGKPLDLIISANGEVRWLETQGIQLVKPTIIRSHEPASKLADAVKESHEFTVEAWVTPHNAVQSGPARIASVSSDTGSRNFTLGQHRGAVDFRLRTAVTGLNAHPLSLTTTDAVLDAKVSHLVASYSNGVQRLFVDGVQQATVLDQTSDGVIGLAIPISVAARIAYSFFYFVPVSLLLTAFLSTRFQRRTNTLVVPIVLTAGLLGATETCQAFLFDRAIDSELFAWGGIAATLGAFIGRLFVGADQFPQRRAALPSLWRKAI